MAAGGGKDKIEWVKQPVPKFIQQFKERTNQKESPTLDSKIRSETSSANEEDKERDDETPIVCISANGVSQEEAETFLKDSYGDSAEIRIDGNEKKRSHKDEEDDPSEDSNKMTFKKPSKEESQPKKKKSKMKKVKNTKLLSFGDEEEEEEE